MEIECRYDDRIYADHLNTPRLVAGAAGTTVWRWDQQEPFGNNPADENPSGLGAFDLPLRLPGQYFDRETSQTYNWHRDYDAAIGRYLQSDPIGLWGGLNTYVYAKSSPLRYIDPRGLKVERCCRSAQLLFGKVDHCWLKTDTKTAGMNSSPTCRIAGDEYEPPYSTPVYVSDHSCDTGSCQLIDDIDEDCVNEELGIGRSLGKFDLAFNNCRSFANSVIEKCSTKNIPRTPYFGNTGR